MSTHSQETEVLAILEVVRIVENDNVPCCFVDYAAEKYYGVPRLREAWVLCVPTEKVDRVKSLFTTLPNSEKYDVAEAYLSNRPKRPQSLLHAFQRFKIKNLEIFFIVTPADDAHIMCTPENITRSLKYGVPYPKLSIFVQAAIDKNDDYQFTEVVDGMDLNADWGSEHLDLSGTVDGDWIEKKNEKIRASVPQTEFSFLLELPTTLFNRKEVWEEALGSQERRMSGGKYPKDLFKTKFRVHGSEDPTHVVRFL